ncbi:hypothetical protein B0J13DRAFT_657119 [Dactylonectria estremocensis]|uniref:Glucose-methanol-choline oxidoreductase N-terminal domain-containing protein n=1 Tax=Dactylonectria estremocensis TaxID=1079267 RepID=A0A9P9D6H7_9HYPO|nr:hypothetical protein B0J13DRAFT_657119 [Dactylonectria estremocensis]
MTITQPAAATADAFSRRHFDFLIIGGGTAGLAVAARLAEADASFTVGVLKAGGIVEDDEDIDIPGHYGRALPRLASRDGATTRSRRPRPPLAARKATRRHQRPELHGLESR